MSRNLRPPDQLPACQLPLLSPLPLPAPPAALFPSRASFPSLHKQRRRGLSPPSPLPSCPSGWLKSRDERQASSGGAGRFGRGNRPEPEKYRSGAGRQVLEATVAFLSPRNSSLILRTLRRDLVTLRTRGTGTTDTPMTPAQYPAQLASLPHFLLPVV